MPKPIYPANSMQDHCHYCQLAFSNWVTVLVHLLSSTNGHYPIRSTHNKEERVGADKQKYTLY